MRISITIALATVFRGSSAVLALEPAACGAKIPLNAPQVTRIPNPAYYFPQTTPAPRPSRLELAKRQAGSLLGWEYVSGTSCKYYEVTRQVEGVALILETDRTFNCPTSQQLLFSGSYGGCCSGVNNCEVATSCLSRTLYYGDGGTGIW
jgi:hypothetical protein